MEANQSLPPAGISEAEWKVRVDLAACYRLVAQNGWTDLIFTHISARVPGTDHHYLLNPFGLAFDEVMASNLVKIDLEGNKLDASEHRIHKAGFVIHSAVHQARADANCIIHLHTTAGMAVSALQCGLLPLTQHAMLFTGKVGYHESEGLALDLAERERLSRDLGDNCVLFLRNHGTLVVGSTVPEAFSMMWHLEQACKAQMMALASGQPLNQPPAGIPEAIARLGFNTRRLDEYTEGRSPLGWMEWPSLLRRLDRTDASYRQ
jgi:ribulose-5-phosphate 4-epimerase/fuculose-1-phosphate aldolase